VKANKYNYYKLRTVQLLPSLS